MYDHTPSNQNTFVQNDDCWFYYISECSFLVNVSHQTRYITQFWTNVGPPSTSLAQQWTNIGLMYRVYWECCWASFAEPSEPSCSFHSEKWLMIVSRSYGPSSLMAVAHEEDLSSISFGSCGGAAGISRGFTLGFCNQEMLGWPNITCLCLSAASIGWMPRRQTAAHTSRTDDAYNQWNAWWIKHI